MRSVLIVHPNSHIANGLADMLDGVLEELYLNPSEVLTANSLAEATDLTQKRGVSLMLLDAELLTNATQASHLQLPGVSRKRVLLVRDSQLKKGRETIKKRVFSALLRMPIERESLKYLLVSILS